MSEVISEVLAHIKNEHHEVVSTFKVDEMSDAMLDAAHAASHALFAQEMVIDITVKALDPSAGIATVVIQQEPEINPESSDFDEEYVFTSMKEFVEFLTGAMWDKRTYVKSVMLK